MHFSLTDVDQVGMVAIAVNVSFIRVASMAHVINHGSATARKDGAD